MVRMVNRKAIADFLGVTENLVGELPLPPADIDPSDHVGGFRPRRCRLCGDGSIRPVFKRGSTVAIPTCDRCGSEWINHEIAAALDREQTFDPAERAREKQASRDEDARAIAAGEKTADQVRRENGAFAFPRDRVRLTWPNDER